MFPNSWSASSPVRLRKLRFWWNLLVAVTYPKWNSLQQQQQLQQAAWGGGGGGGGGGSERTRQTLDRKPRERNWGKEDCVATEAQFGEVSKQINKTQQKLNKTNKTHKNSTKPKKTQQNVGSKSSYKMNYLFIYYLFIEKLVINLFIYLFIYLFVYELFIY